MAENFKNRKNTFHSSDWFDENFFGKFLSSNEENKVFLNNQIYKINEEKLSSRLINHWCEVGVLDDDRPNGKGWKKFSISELIWIQIVFKLRGFGLDLSRIKKVKQEINLYKIDGDISKCPLLDFHIILAKNTTSPIKLVVFESGEASINRQIEIDMANQLGMISEDYISIDLNKLVENFFTSKKITTDYLGYSDIPKSEIVTELEKSLSEEDIESVSIKVSGNNYLIDKKYLKDNKSDASKIISLINYGECKEVIHNGKSIFHLVIKKKIRK